MARIAGVKRIAIAKIKKIGATLAETEYETPITLPNLVSFSGSENRSSTSWYSGDLVEETFENVVDYDLEFVLGNISNRIKALITGAQVNTAGTRSVTNSNDVQPQFALIVELAQLGENASHPLEQVYYNCKFSVDTIEGETQTDSITDSPVTVKGKAIPLPTTGAELMAEADGYDNAATAAITNWFTKPHGSKAVSLLSEK